jgi:transposase
LVKQRTMNVNALRGHLAEFGLIVAKGIHRLEELIALARAETTLPDDALAAVEMLALQTEQLDTPIASLAKSIGKTNAKSPTSQLLLEVPGVGPLIASAMTASYPDPGVFKSGRDFSASLGITPNQYSSGGKEKLGVITKKGNRDLRKARRGMHLGAARGRQIQRRPGRVDRLDEKQEAGAGRRGRAGQQARPDLLGDHVHRRRLPGRAFHQSLKLAANRKKGLSKRAMTFRSLASAKT